MGGEELGRKMVDWFTVALAFPEHPAGVALTAALQVLDEKRLEVHETRDRLQTLKCRLLAATALALGTESMMRDEKENNDTVEGLLRRRLGIPEERHDNGSAMEFACGGDSACRGAGGFAPGQGQ